MHRPRLRRLVAAEGQARARARTGRTRRCARSRRRPGFAASSARSSGRRAIATARGAPKLVRWWPMRPLGGEFEPNDEVDELRWLDAGRGARAARLRPRPRLVSLVAVLVEQTSSGRDCVARSFARGEAAQRARWGQTTSRAPLGGRGPPRGHLRCQSRGAKRLGSFTCSRFGDRADVWCAPTARRRCLPCERRGAGRAPRFTARPRCESAHPHSADDDSCSRRGRRRRRSGADVLRAGELVGATASGSSRSRSTPRDDQSRRAGGAQRRPRFAHDRVTRPGGDHTPRRRAEASKPVIDSPRRTGSRTRAAPGRGHHRPRAILSRVRPRRGRQSSGWRPPYPDSRSCQKPISSSSSCQQR